MLAMSLVKLVGCSDGRWLRKCLVLLEAEGGSMYEGFCAAQLGWRLGGARQNIHQWFCRNHA